MTRRSGLDGVVYGALQRFPDSRGSFAEVWRASGLAGGGPFAGVQANLSVSAAGVLRGMHLHERQADRWIVLSGKAYVALVDVRPRLRDPRAPVSVETAELGPDDTGTIPPYVAHGFLALEPLELLYVVTNEYDGTDERGFAWDDVHASIAWPTVETSDGLPILSERDQANPPLDELLRLLRPAGC